ncbi:hypothetical protein APJL_2022 [Actinobacillus pleuropneumoniae serovar 3 str. JL03]|uniref:Uncharacterized protein n=1 Tax=Actinobacillus pleuropneumoniae serotype 3 (strain JL03) TaxID=434271 RepID=B0BU00_ACTPJ|nr:hypothetical protein APJL_2022 [Actinobacillus pleuropneumoniae serovar 3 str. JL03]
MGHLTRYLLKKAFQLFCFYPIFPEEMSWDRLETDLNVGLRLRRRIIPFFMKKGSVLPR